MLATLAYRAADGVVGLLPRPAAEAMARSLARAAFAMRVPARAHLEQNLARLLPQSTTGERRRSARAAFEHFALALVDFLALSRESPGALLAETEVDGARHLRGALDSARGVLVLSAHVGHWERGAASLGAMGVPLRLAARVHEGGVERLFRIRREAFGVQVLRGAARTAVVAALRRGEWVAVMADRGARREGRPGSVCEWAAVLARRTGALVLPVITVRQPSGRHALIVGAPLDADACREGELRSRLRGWLRQHADQWSAFEPLPEGLA